MSTYNKVVSEEENISQLMEGLKIMADTVGSTLGPRGKNVILQTEYGSPHITKDGVSVAKSIHLEGVAGIGASLLKEVASKAAIVGDGTTSATVLAYYLAKNGISMAKSHNAFGIKRGMERACNDVVEWLKNHTTQVVSPDDIYNIALVSTNHDDFLASMFKKAYELAGKDGIIVVDKTNNTSTTCERVEGMQFDRGFEHPAFINDEERQECYFENPNIVIIDGDMSNLVELGAFFSNLGSSLYEKPLAIIAEKFDDNVLNTFIVNKIKNGARVLLIRAPGFGDRRKEWVTDIAAFTGATVVCTESGVSLSTFTTEHFGHCDRLVSDFDKTTILGGIPNSGLENLKASLRGLAQRAITDVDKQRHKQRLARLSDGIVSIKIGGNTEVEIKELADRVDDALCAVKASIQGGYSCGGGTSLINASLNVKNEYDAWTSEYVGFNLVVKACKSTLHKICCNLGDEEYSADYVCSKVCQTIKEGNPTFGFDAQKLRFENNMIESGIIDPTDVIISSLKNAVSVASLLLSSSASVVKDSSKSCKCDNSHT